MVDFLRQLDWVLGYLGVWLNIIRGVSVRECLDEVSK